MTITRITGYTQKGVPPTADRALYAALAGPDSYVLPYGAKIAASLKDAQHLTVQDGAILHNGTLSTFDGSTEFVIPPGVQGSKRSNIAVARHLNDGTIESTIPLVLSGEPTSDGEPVDPTWETGNLLDGVTVSDMPLYRVVTDGISAGEPEPMFDMLASISDVRDSQSQPQLLWQGVAGSGDTIEVPGIQNCVAVFVVMYGGPGMPMFIHGSSLYGGISYELNDGSINQAGMSATVSKDTLSIRFCSVRKSSGIYEHTYRITAIYRLI